MDNTEVIVQSLSQILIPYDISPRTELFQRIIFIKAGIIDYKDLWNRYFFPPTFQLKNSPDAKKIDITFSDYQDHADKLITFMRVNCDPNATLTKKPFEECPDLYHCTITVDFELMKTQLLPYFQDLINTMAKENVPELTPYRYISEYDPLVLKKYYKNKMGMNDPNNPFGLVMNEIDENVAKLGISICYSQLIEYSLMLLVGERCPNLEKIRESTVPVKYIIPSSWTKDYVDLGWGICYYKVYPSQAEVDLKYEDNGQSIKFFILDKHFKAQNKIASFLQSLCKVSVDCGSYYKTYKISTKDFYEKVLPKFKEFLQGMTSSNFPELYENLKAVSQADPDVQRLQNVVDKTWKSVPINFPENNEKPKPESQPTPPPSKVEPSKPKHHCFFNHVTEKLREVLHCADNKRGFRLNS